MNTKTAPQTFETTARRGAEGPQEHRGRPAVRVGGASPMRTIASVAGPRDDVGRRPEKPKILLMRGELGDVLRTARHRQQKTLRDISEAARVSLGYLSEVERGHKEASSELLASICDALDMPLWETLREVADRMAAAEGIDPRGQDHRRRQRLALVR
ncbi:MAG: helix-turn-helix domain-containing protein [Bifidobacteriaceae bacterium]|jgi:hypothetical protein|nr:helix-turn-helix domain-containing protein [Bifidobacteriaceae bacterium]